uniref:Uncharacterized protein n=1 Tax=Panagrolaimus davidi TaxID=227884 RepID=A0A914PW20_9BILA
MGKLTDYDYIASTERNVGLYTIIDSITENLEVISNEKTENGIFYNDAYFFGDATRFMLSEKDELTIAEFDINFREGTFHQTSFSVSYTLVNLTIDIGSSLSLYFGFTVLTLFEVIIFFFYGRSDEITNLYPAPSKTIIYDLPNKKMVAKRTNNLDIKRKLAAERQRQWNHALRLPPIS